jgi:hypothetical protein
MSPLATSLLYILRSSPYKNGVQALAVPIVSHISTGNMQRFEDMLIAGMVAAAQGVYLAGTPVTEGGAATMDNPVDRVMERTAVRVVYQAYGWARGWRGLISLAGLGAVSIAATILAAFGFVTKRLRFDPSDFAQAVFVALGSRLDPPANTCTGDLPPGTDRQELYYGPAKGSNRLQFSHRPTSTGLESTERYGNVE